MSKIDTAWEYVSPDGSKALVNAVIPTNHGNMPEIYITLSTMRLERI